MPLMVVVAVVIGVIFMNEALYLGRYCFFSFLFDRVDRYCFKFETLWFEKKVLMFSINLFNLLQFGGGIGVDGWFLWCDMGEI